ncbi:MAG TPA: nuclear transport factor 2 family protein [Sphingomicrobium sp.]|nr:nuclear transport factor 2 family protein [Sphingomicrobium sp.]
MGKTLLLAAAPLLIAAAPSWQRQALSSAAPFIDKAYNEWTRAIVSGDADVLSAPYAPNGIFIGPDGSEVRGRDAVRAMYAKSRGDLKIVKASIHSDGRAAHDAGDVYEWGTASMTVEQGGKIRQAKGRYLTVWHRSGKRWLISHNIAF